MLLDMTTLLLLKKEIRGVPTAWSLEGKAQIQAAGRWNIMAKLTE